MFTLKKSLTKPKSSLKEKLYSLKYCPLYIIYYKPNKNKMKLLKIAIKREKN